MRIFVASSLTTDFRQKVMNYQPKGAEGVRLTPSERQHMTLQFIGDEDPERVHKAIKAVSFAAFKTYTSGTGIFSPKKSKHILWLGLNLTSELQALHDSITKALAENEIHIDTRSYTPHITLARCKRSMDRAFIDAFLSQDIETAPYPIEQFHLYHSHNVDGQLRYDILESYPSICHSR